ncbi:MAG: putative ABC transporter permease [Coriobacteriales bacterium]|nr:putative ABC transporter permease [Coriobacteriales bacterium]
MPNKIPIPVRFIEVYYFIIILFGALYAVLIEPEIFLYDTGMYYALFQMAVAVMSIWLIERRSVNARIFIPLAAILSSGFSAINLFFSDAYITLSSLISTLTINVFITEHLVIDIAIFIYFLASKKVKECFTTDINVVHHVWTKAKNKISSSEDENNNEDTNNNRNKQIEETKKKINKPKRLSDYVSKPFTWPWVRNAIIYFCLFSIVGHWAEIVFCKFIEAGFFMGDVDYSNLMLWEWWLHPFPAEGIAVVLGATIIFPFKEWLVKKMPKHKILPYVIIFGVTAFISVGIDFTTGITANANYELWDYRELPFNFMGQIVLQNSLVYSLAAFVIIVLVYPLLERFLNSIPRSVAHIIFAAVVGIFIFLECLYFDHMTPEGISFG